MMDGGFAMALPYYHCLVGSFLPVESCGRGKNGRKVFLGHFQRPRQPRSVGRAPGLVRPTTAKYNANRPIKARLGKSGLALFDEFHCEARKKWPLNAIIFQGDKNFLFSIIDKFFSVTFFEKAVLFWPICHRGSFSMSS